MRMPPLPADFIHARACKLKCEKILTRPDAAVQAYAQTVREQCAEEVKKLAQLQKMWALRKPVLDAHILSLQEKVMKLEQEIDAIVMERMLKNNR